MANEIITPPLNTYSTGVTGGTGYPGDAATGLGQREFISYMDALLPYNTKFDTMLGKGGTVTQSKLEGGRRKRKGVQLTVNEALTNSDTTITFTSAALVHPGMVILIEYDGVNAEEVVWVPMNSTITATDVGVLRGQGTPAVAHLTAITATIIGVATPDGSNHPTAPVQFGNQWFNYRQRFAEAINIDSAEDIQHDWEHPNGNIFETRLAETASYIKLLREMAFLRGRRAVGAPSTNTANKLGGLYQFAGEIADNFYDLNGGLLNIYDFETVLRDGLNTVDSAFGDVAIMSNTVKAIIDTSFNAARRAGMDTTSGKFMVDTLTFSAGELTFVPLRDEVWPSTAGIAIVRMSDVKYYPYQGLDWHFARQVPGVDTGGDFKIGSISCDVTFMPSALETMSLIGNFVTDISQYPRDLAI